jgi:DNA-binding response OmpR family regulator
MNPTCSCGKFRGGRAEIPASIVVIDDEPLVRWSLVAGLRQAGFDAVPAATLEESCGRGQRTADIVLVDVRLWGRDPQNLIEQLRSFAPGCRILLLAVEGQDLPLSGWSDVDVIRKPFDLAAVVRRVEHALACPPHDVKIAV